MFNLISLYLVLIAIAFFCLKREDTSKNEVKFLVVLSGAFFLLTRQRLDIAIKMAKKLQYVTVVVCGKKQALQMYAYLKKNGITKVIVEDKSTNTYEDAYYTEAMLPQNELTDIVLITSPTHQRRAYNTFRKIFKGKIYNAPSNALFSFDSILTPIGWVGLIANSVKDFKYNK